MVKRGFTMVELCVAMGIFAVLGSLVYFLGFGMTRRAADSARKAATTSEILGFTQRIHTEARKAEQFDWPPLNLPSESMKFFVAQEEIGYEFQNGALIRRTFTQEREILKGLKQIRFERPQTRLLRILFEFEDEEPLITAVFLESLR